MIKPFNAVAIQSQIIGCRNREEIRINLKHLEECIDFGILGGSLEGPVKLVAFSEGAIQGFYDEMTNMDSVEYCEKIAISIPGDETEILAKKAKQYGIYIIACAKALEPDLIKDRFFNTAFIISPEGKIIHKHRKTRVFPIEHSTTPYDIWDIWIEKMGDGIEALYPVTETELGKIGTIICYESRFPETARALAVNGAEIIYKTSLSAMRTFRDYFELQNRARAIDNCCYIIAPNIGPYFRDPEARYPTPPLGGGQSMIVDYQGRILGRAPTTEQTYVVATINVAEVRNYRTESAFSLLPHLIEPWGKIYEKAVWPKNLYLHNPPWDHQKTIKHYQEIVKNLIAKGTFTLP
ncbi:MAG: hydrolase [Proteobacteria bacterium]|nr:hydrolase [Pseudomonadota bacterium]